MFVPGMDFDLSDHGFPFEFRAFPDQKSDWITTVQQVFGVAIFRDLEVGDIRAHGRGVKLRNLMADF
jgi:hypothetical protein